jgi:hypothetical protein
MSRDVFCWFSEKYLISLFRHSRVGGNPEFIEFTLDPLLQGDDERAGGVDLYIVLW